MPQQPDETYDEEYLFRSKILGAIEKQGPLTRSQILDSIGGCTLPKFYRTMALLIERKLVTKTGRTKGTKYLLVAPLL
jgi:CRP-like cAMP-binding protein